jgi:hypothetical protein
VPEVQYSVALDDDVGVLEHVPRLDRAEVPLAERDPAN